MIVLVIRKISDEVMPPRQDTPTHNPGRMINVVVIQHGGVARDYMEKIVPPEDTQAVLKAKDLIYNPKTDEIEIIPFDSAEEQLRQKEPELETVEDRLIMAHIQETAALDLGMNAERITVLKTALAARRDVLVAEIGDLKK